MIKTSYDKGLSSLFIVHRRELVMQSAKAFDLIGVPFGVISPDFPFEPSKKVQIASIQTLSRRLALLKYNPSLIVYDECHHLPAKNWAMIYNYFSSSYRVGLTATPCRLDGKGLKDFFSKIVDGPSMRDLIDQGFLSDYKLFASQTVDTTGVKSRMGDYVTSQVENLVKQNEFTGNAINEYRKHCDGKRAIVFCVSIEHSEYVSKLFNEAGIRSECVDGTTHKVHRSAALKRFESGETKILCNVDLFGEGFDISSIEAVIMLRPTQSLSLYLQQVGRALRPSPGKTHAIIIDHVGNWNRHGLPDDYREWSLDGINKKNKSDMPPAKLCPMCFAAMPSAKYSCDSCGYEFERIAKETKPLEFNNESLKEIDKTQVRKTKIDIERSKAKTKDELFALAVQRGYKKPHGWVHHIMQSRQRRKLNQ
jgi:superfamily II DNA or RNA helicase